MELNRQVHVPAASNLGKEFVVRIG